MATAIFLVAAAAAIGVGLVVYGIVSPRRAAAAAGESGLETRVTFRTLADVREQLRRRFEPTGAPVWIAANDKAGSLARDLASADLDLRPYEFRILQAGLAIVMALVGLVRFGVSVPVIVLAAIGYVLPRSTFATAAATGSSSSKPGCHGPWS